MKLALCNVNYLRERVKLTPELWMAVKYLLCLKASDPCSYFRAPRSFSQKKVTVDYVLFILAYIWSRN